MFYWLLDQYTTPRQSREAFGLHFSGEHMRAYSQRDLVCLIEESLTLEIIVHTMAKSQDKCLFSV
jgi:hypothetical protein